MNKSFKVVFNKARGALMVVNEVTSSVQAKGTKTVIAAAVAALAAGVAGATEIPEIPEGVKADTVEVTDWKDIDSQNVFETGAQKIVMFHTVKDQKSFEGDLWVVSKNAATSAKGFYVNGEKADFINEGNIYITSEASWKNQAILADVGGKATNEGLIVAKNAYGMTVGTTSNGDKGSTIINNNRIVVEETGVGMELGGADGSTAVNKGTIVVGTPVEGGFTHGVLIKDTSNNEFTNYGTIEAAKGATAIEVQVSKEDGVVTGTTAGNILNFEAGSKIVGEVHIQADVTGTVINANGFKGTVDLNNESDELTLNLADGSEVTLTEGHASTVSEANIVNGRLNASIWGADNKFGKVVVEKDGIFNITKLNSGGDSKDLENKPHNQLLIKGADYTLNGGKLFVAGSNYEGKLKLGTIDTKGTLTVNGGDYAFSSVIMGGAAGNALTINNGSVTVGEYNATWGTTAVNGGVLSIGTLKLENAPVGTLTVGDDATLEITDGIKVGENSKDYVTVEGTLRTDASIAVAKNEEGAWEFTATDAMDVFESADGSSLELTGINSFTKAEYDKLSGDLGQFDLFLVDGQMSNAADFDLGKLTGYGALNNVIAVNSEQGEAETASATLIGDVGVGAIEVGEKTKQITVQAGEQQKAQLLVRGLNGKVIEGVDSVDTLTVGDLTLGAYATDKAVVNAGELVVDSLDVVGDFTAQHVTINVEGSTDNRFSATSLEGEGNFKVHNGGTLEVRHLAIDTTLNEGSTLVLGDRLPVNPNARAPEDDVQYIPQIATAVQTTNVDTIVTTNADGRNLLKAVAGDAYDATKNVGLYVDHTIAVDGASGKLVVSTDTTYNKSEGNITFGDTAVVVIDVGAFENGQSVFEAEELQVNKQSKVFLTGADRISQVKLIDSAAIDEAHMNHLIDSLVDSQNAWLDHTVVRGEGEDSINTYLATTFHGTGDASLDGFAESVLTTGSESLGVINAIGTVYNDNGTLSEVGEEALYEYMALPVVAGTYNAAYDAAEQVWNTVGAHNIARTPGKANGVWADVFYTANEAKGMYDDGYGYEADVYGGVLGYDYTAACGGKIGAALTIGTSDVDATGDFIGRYGNDADFWGLSIYASKDITDKMIVSADVTYLSLDNDINGSVAGASVDESIDSSVISVGLRADWKAYESNAFEIVPHAGIRYAQIDVDDYREFDGESLDVLEMPVGVAFNGKFEAAGMKFVPTLDFTVVPQIGDKDVKTFDGDTLDVLNNTYNTTLGISAEYGDFTFGVAAKYGFGTDDRSNAGVKVNATYAF